MKTRTLIDIMEDIDKIVEEHLSTVAHDRLDALLRELIARAAGTGKRLVATRLRTMADQIDVETNK